MNSYINKFYYDSSNFSKDFEVACLTFFWTEGSKYRKSVEVTNSDSKIIELFSIFLLEVCHIEPLKIKGRLQIHEGNSINDAKKFWSSLCKIDEKNITISIRKAKESIKKNKHPYGIFSVRYNSVGLKKFLDDKITELKNSSFNV